MYRRKRLLLRHLHATRQRLLRLHVVTAWSSKANAMANVARVLDVCGTPRRRAARRR